MLIRNNTLNESANSILENATYLYESEMPNVSAYSIPVVANDRFNAGIVSYEDLNRLCEDNNIEIVDGIVAIAEANNIDPNDIVVSIDESTIIMDPYVIDEVHQYVVSPVSESHIVSQYTDAMVGAWLESGDDYYLQAIGEPEIMLEADDDKPDYYNLDTSKNIASRAKDYSKKMKELGKKSAKVGDETIKPDDPNFLVKIKRFLTDKPREYLARAVARLRQTYNKFLIKADKENDESKIKWYKQIARKILQAVDWVLSKIQKAATIDYGKRINKAQTDYYEKLNAANEKKTLNNSTTSSTTKANVSKPTPTNSTSTQSEQPSQGGKTIPKSVITNSQYNKTLLQRKLHGVVPIQRVKGTLIRDSRGRIIKDKNGNPMIAHTTI